MNFLRASSEPWGILQQFADYKEKNTTIFTYWIEGENVQFVLLKHFLLDAKMISTLHLHHLQTILTKNTHLEWDGMLHMWSKFYNIERDIKSTAAMSALTFINSVSAWVLSVKTAQTKAKQHAKLASGSLF